MSRGSAVKTEAAGSMAQPISTPGNAALHRAMNPGLQKGNLGFAIE
jgi:hypothetical protein